MCFRCIQCVHIMFLISYAIGYILINFRVCAFQFICLFYNVTHLGFSGEFCKLMQCLFRPLSHMHMLTDIAKIVV